MKEITIGSNQSLFDIAIQETGAPEAAFLLALDNDIEITETLKPGSLLLYSGEIISPDIYNYYRTRNIKPATALKDYSEPSERIFDYSFDLTFE